MSDLDDAVKQRIRNLSDKDLIKMLTASPDEYRPEALAFANSETQRRRLRDISANAVTRLAEEEQRQAAASEKENPSLEPIRNARGLRASFDIFCVFAGFPIARFVSLTIPADKPADFMLYSRILFFVCGFGGLIIGDLLFRSMIVPRKTKTARGLLAAMVMISAFILYAFGSQVGKELQRRHMAVDSVRYESKMENVPTGFEGATWLMSEAQVRAAFPNAVELGDPDTLCAQTTAFGRPAVAGFMFKNNLLLQIAITFTGEKTSETYQQTHKLVEQEYGSFPPPTSSGQYTLASEKQYDRVMVQHLMFTHSGMPVEQVILYRTKAKTSE